MLTNVINCLTKFSHFISVNSVSTCVTLALLSSTMFRFRYKELVDILHYYIYQTLLRIKGLSKKYIYLGFGYPLSWSAKNLLLYLGFSIKFDEKFNFCWNTSKLIERNDTVLVRIIWLSALVHTWFLNVVYNILYC